MSTDNHPYRPLLVAAVLLVLTVLLWVARSVFIPVAFGVLFTFILTPAVGYLQARGLRRAYAVLLVIFFTVALLGGTFTALGMQLRDLAVDLPRHKNVFAAKIRDLFGGGPGVFGNLTKLVDELTVEMKQAEAKPSESLALPVRVVQDRTPGLGLLTLLAGPLSGTLGALSLTVGLTVSMLVMREDLRNRLFLLLGDGHLTSTTRALDDASKRISKYLFTQVLLNAAFGFCFGVGLAILQVPYALVWGVLAALLRFVPFIGTWLAAVFPVMVSLSVAGWGTPLAVTLLAVGLGVLTNNIVEPRLVSRSTGVTPIALVIATAFWTWLWGPIGLILSTPMTVCLSVLGRHVPALRFLDVLLGSAAPLGVEVQFYQRLLARDEAEAGDLLEVELKTSTPDEVFDRVIGPALARARLDNERGHLHNNELAALVESVRDIVVAEMGDPVDDSKAEVVLLGCPVAGDLDRLTLELLGRILLPGRVRIEMLSADATASDAIGAVGEYTPTLVCLANVPPAGGARARYLCKRLRAAYPDLALFAALTGAEEGMALREQLLSAGATRVTTTFADARAQLVPLLQVAANREAV